ncbi:hypothetical protein [Bartonella choladocola]
MTPKILTPSVARTCQQELENFLPKSAKRSPVYHDCVPVNPNTS